jgi:hypothetical protein
MNGIHEVRGSIPLGSTNLANALGVRYGRPLFVRVAVTSARNRSPGWPDHFLFDEDFFLDEDFLRGTLPPSFRASDSPMAIACFLLVTFFPERPLFKVPSLRSCIAFSTFFEAFFPYLAIFSPP